MFATLGLPVVLTDPETPPDPFAKCAECGQPLKFYFRYLLCGTHLVPLADRGKKG